MEVIKNGLDLLLSEEAKNMFNDKDACAEIGKILKADSILIQTWNVPHCSAQSFPFPSEVQEIEVKKESGRSWSVEFVRDFPIDAWHNHYTGYVVCVDRMVSGIYRLCDVHPSSEGEKQRVVPIHLSQP